MNADATAAYAEHAQEVVRFATALVGPSSSEDIAAIVMARVLSSHTWRSVENLRAYLFRAVTNEVRSQSRADRRRWIREERVGVRDLAPDAELLVDVIDAVRLLSIRQRAVVYLTYWLGMRAEEVARTLDVSPRTVERELTSARGRLEVLLR
ncbi:MAG TPA: RNA polymerase sigma factor [Ilumatobacteraceae bacterium]|nr:RNA polymerase sigma factor [Ilumatobacteraceae bacterium]